MAAAMVSLGTTTMGKAYPEVLAQWVVQSQASRRDRNLVAFLAVRDEIKAALAAGYSRKVIWKNLVDEKRIDVCYDTFRRHVNRYVKQVQAPDGAEVVPGTASPSILTRTPSKKNSNVISVATPRADRGTKSPESLPGFSFNPKPNKEDLI